MSTFEELALRISFSPEGTVLLCECSDLSVRESLVGQARQEVATPAGIVIDASLVQVPWLGTYVLACSAKIAAEASPGQQKLCAHVLNLEKLSGRRWFHVVRGLQSRRDDFHEKVGGLPPPVSVLWLTSPLYRDVVRSAPDFYHVGKTLQFTASSPEVRRPPGAVYVDPRSNATSPREGERVIEGWIHGVRGRSVELYLQEPQAIVTASLSDFLSLPLDLTPGTPITMASWVEGGTNHYQFRTRETADRRPERERAAPPGPRNWDDEVEVNAYLSRLREHLGKDGGE